MNRRTVLQAALAAGTAPTWPIVGAEGANAAEGQDRNGDGSFPGILDSNVSLFRWPFRRLPLDETEALVTKLRSLGVTAALAGSFEGPFHRDLAAANARLAEACAAHPELIPAGSIDPSLPAWERDLDRYATGHGMPAVRLFPGHHGYGLDNPRFTALLEGAAANGLLVQLAVTLEDPRTQPELAVVPELDLAPLPAAMEGAPGARVQLLNLRPRGALPETLAEMPRLHFDTARADGTDGVASLMEQVGRDRVLFGTHAPFLVPEAALVRVHESALDPDPLRAVLRGNADRLLSTAAA